MSLEELEVTAEAVEELENELTEEIEAEDTVEAEEAAEAEIDEAADEENADDEDWDEDWDDEEDTEPEPLANIIEKTRTISWEIDEDGVLLIRGNGRIPDFNVGKEPVPAPWSEVADEITELEIEEGITEIGMATFKDCRNLGLVVLPKSLVKIHSYAFSGCTQLTDVYYDLSKSFVHMHEQSGKTLRMSHSLQEKKKAKGLIVMGMQAFAETPWAIEMWGDYYVSGGVLIECIHETSIVAIPEDVEEIGAMAFQNKKVSSVLFREGLRNIERFAFQNTEIREISLPSTIRKVAYGAFAGTPLQKALIGGNGQAEVDPGAFIDTNIDLDPNNMHAYELCADPEGIAVDGVNKLGVTLRKVKEAKKGGKIEGFAGFDTAEVYTPVMKLLQGQKAVIGITTNDVSKTVIAIQTLVWNKKDKKPALYELTPMDALMRKDDMTPDNDAGAKRITKDEVKEMFPSQNAKGMLAATSISPVDLVDRTHTEWYSTADRNAIGGHTEYAIMQAWLEKYPEYKIQM